MHELNKQHSKRITIWWITLLLTFSGIIIIIIDPLDENVASLTPCTIQD